MKYVLTVIGNFDEAEKWVLYYFELEEYTKNAINYMIKHGEPYQCIPIYTGTKEECKKIAIGLNMNLEETLNSLTIGGF